jgi:hypothetical protein
MPDLRCVVYVSTATAAMTDATLEALLIEARRLNLKAAVTGVLLYDDGTFMQCFEGPPAAVDEVYTRIRGSRQHTRIVELFNEAVPGRSFPDWLMGFARPTRSALLALSSARWENRSRSEDGEPKLSPGLALLLHFWRNAHERA